MLHLTDFQTFFGYFHVFLVVEHIKNSFRTITFKKWDFSKKSKNSIFGQFLPILATFYEVKITFLKKLVEQARATYLKFDVFWIYMLWGNDNQH
jgi:hypothetical protein